ncbi:hypothetical protein FTUN_0523 [Frigoriglobus tundricola]|uniref:Uncharacterized protein n=1 Tax=Frigoriglobus tundricola TaxID=2774151 RepID=A0A6M5YIF4_9BACT|nr:hypothetical protein FTUN_0523 [Frigoriglobus tundricola]
MTALHMRVTHAIVSFRAWSERIGEMPYAACPIGVSKS